jgi:thiamine phosphate synthase YjbQ (UPF0047 family)
VLLAFVPPQVAIPVIGGRLALGTWQSIAPAGLNAGNQSRQVCLSFLSG